MPLLSIQTNISISKDREAFLKTASALIAEQLAKPETYVMVQIQDGLAMSFGGSTEPLAYVELKSIGLPENKTSQLSDNICTLIQEELDIPANRTYIEFANAPRAMWGWNGGTF